MLSNEIMTHGRLWAGYKKVQDLIGIVARTLGPAGRPVCISKGFGSPYITKDGYSVAKAIKPKQRLIRMIWELLQQVTSGANEGSGDGTTTSLVFAGSVVNRLLPAISTGSVSLHYAVRNSILHYRDFIIDSIKKMARPIGDNEGDNYDDIINAATVSANGDREVGEAIAQAMRRVGRRGVITVEEDKGREKLFVQVNEGMSFDRGYASPYFVNDAEKMIVEFDDAAILLMNKKVTAIQPMIKLLEESMKRGMPIVIIAEDFDNDALTGLVVNKLRGLKVAAVKAPGFGDRRRDMLEDIRILVGGRSEVVSDDLGTKLENLDFAQLGVVKKIKISKDNTTIIADSGRQDKKGLEARIEFIKKEASNKTTSEYDREKLTERLAKLTNGVAIIKVGGISEVELKELKDMVEDALHAAQAAVEEGIVPGGGVALLNISNAISELKAESEEDRTALLILREALRAPIMQLLQNANLDPTTIISNLSNKGDETMIYDVAKKEYVDAYKSGIVDPAKVVRVAIEAAISVISTLMTTQAFLVDLPEENNGGSGGGGMGGGMGGMGGGF